MHANGEILRRKAIHHHWYILAVPIYRDREVRGGIQHVPLVPTIILIVVDLPYIPGKQCISRLHGNKAEDTTIYGRYAGPKGTTRYLLLHRHNTNACECSPHTNSEYKGGYAKTCFVCYTPQARCKGNRRYARQTRNGLPQKGRNTLSLPRLMKEFACDRVLYIYLMSESS